MATESKFEVGLVRLRLPESMDSAAALALRMEFETLASTTKTGDVALDMTSVSALDGSGVGAIAYLFKRLAPQGRRVVVEGASGQPRAMLERLGLSGPLNLDGRGRRARARVGGMRVGGLRAAGLLAACLAVSACTVWPNSGSGGVAEWREPDLLLASSPLPEQVSSELEDEALLLRARLSCAATRFAAVRSASEEKGVLTGKVGAAAEIEARGRREFATGLLPDANVTLGRLDAELPALEIELGVQNTMTTSPECAR